jgi:voltage-gated sodium channel type II alpha
LQTASTRQETDSSEATQTAMSDDSSSVSEEERCLFRPFTRESLAAIETRIAEEYAKQKELEKKRAEGEVGN